MHQLFEVSRRLQRDFFNQGYLIAFLTPFQEKIYKVVKEIPRGGVLTYKQVARAAGYPRAFRAVGNTLNKNINTKIPCHRVVRSDGRISGYRKGVRRKVYLLKKEGVLIVNQRLNISS
ncbi:MAG: Methylated-DNA/protein-cysteine methyltransferase [Parcubacteria group bacterium GW2011_GWF2_43_11]|nr:MAG: Methylated-DNA/protein-cysteine methyltransferase [Parcubacteria group bacterium GW2011_GWF2_43_11]